ncbi:MAG: hypothetical protein MI974_32470 [Chitinophagales bacterium]|nr:hypothetical protein [Chitinophagales bacterium]
MNKVFFYLLSVLWMIGYLHPVLAQNGNVGVGTTAPQAKLHINGDVRVDDQLEIKNSNGETIFSFDPESQQFDVLDIDGSVFYRIGIEALGGKNDRSTGSPRVETAKLFNGDIMTNTRRNDGTLESTKVIGQFGSTETFFNADGTLPIKEIDISTSDASVTTSLFSPSGIKTSSFTQEGSGNSIETFFNPNGTERVSTVRFPNSTTQFVNDENGNLIKKRSRVDGVLKFHNKDCEEITKEEFENIYEKKITDPTTNNTHTTTANGTLTEDPNTGTTNTQTANGFTIGVGGQIVTTTPTETVREDGSGKKNTTDAEGNTIENTNTGAMNVQTADEAQISKGDERLSLTSIGMHIKKSIDELFIDLFGVSQFSGLDFAGMSFNPNAGETAIHSDLDVEGNISKQGGSFKIDHPLEPKNKWLYHSFVESPDMMNVYNGNIITGADGKVTVQLPNYFDALNKDFRYQLTVIGSFAQAIISKKIQNNQFVIQTDQPNIEVSWQVTGIRKDPYAETHRIQTEVEKTGDHKGRLLFDPNRKEPYSTNMKKHWDRARKSAEATEK